MESIKPPDQKRTVLSNIALALLALLLSYGAASLLDVTYLCYDDKLLNLSAAGVYGARNAEYLVFINILAGYAVKFLYWLLPGQNMFFGFLLALEALAFFALYQLARKRARTRLDAACMLCALAAMELFFTTHFTYTILAAILSATGVVVLCYGDSGPVRSGVTGGVLLFLGFLIRMPAFIIGFAIGLPALVIQLWSDRRTRRQTVLCLCGCAALCLLALAVDNRVYSANENWRAERERLAYRLVDYNPLSYADHAEELHAIGFSENDLALYYNWMFADTEAFSVEKLSKLSDLLPLGVKYNLNPVSLATGMLKHRNNYIFLAAALLLALPLFFAKNRGRGANRLLFLATLIMAYGAIGGLFIRRRVAVNASLMIYLCGLIVMTFVANAPSKNPAGRPQKYLRVAAATALAALALASSCIKIQNDRQTMRRSAACTSELVAWQAAHPDAVVAMDSNLVNWFFDTPAKNGATDPYWLRRIKLGSWDFDGQRWHDQVERFGVDANRLLTQIAYQDSVVVLVGSEADAERIGVFLNEHAPDETVGTKIAQLPQSGWLLYDFSVVE